MCSGANIFVLAGQGQETESEFSIVSLPLHESSVEYVLLSGMFYAIRAQDHFISESSGL